MKFKQLVSKVLVTGIFISNTGFNSLASTLSEDTRYETFEGDSIKINDILEEDKVNVEIEGNTLVNLHDKQVYRYSTPEVNAGRYVKTEDTNSLKVTINETLESWHLINLGKLNLDLIKPNTTYTVYFEKSKGLTSIRFCYGNHEGNIGNVYSVPVKNNRAVITTTNFSLEDINNNVLLYGLCSSTAGTEIEVSNAMIFEGDIKYDDLYYFESMKSVGEQNNNSNKLTIKSQGKNLFDSKKHALVNRGAIDINIAGEGEDRVYEGINRGQDGLIQADWGLSTFDNPGLNPSKKEDILFLKVKKGDKVYVRAKGTYTRVHIIVRDKNNKYLEGINIGKSGSVNISRDDADRIEFVFGADGLGTRFTVYDVEAGYGELPTMYNSYINDSLEFLLKEPLRGLPNGVSDRIIRKNGQWMIERNCAEIMLDGSNDEVWSRYINGSKDNDDYMVFSYVENTNALSKQIWAPEMLDRGLCNKLNVIGDNLYFPGNMREGIAQGYSEISNENAWIIKVKKSKLNNLNVSGFKEWLKDNPIKFVYEMRTPIYEPIKVNPSVQLFKEITCISNDSIIPANMRVVVDRVLNRATESVKLAKTNPNMENLSRARMWINLIDDSTLKDQLQDEVNSITNIDDLQLERKLASSNLDVYIKSQNMLSMSLDTNSVVFDGYSGTEDMEMLSAVNISINSSLPYQLNAYMPSEISNADKSEILPIDILNIREESEGVYQRFINTADKVILKDSCNAGNNLIHNIDLKLASNLAHKADVYKTVIKFEAEQK